MQKLLYPLLGCAIAAATLTACSTDQPARTTATPAAPGRAATSPAAAAPPAAAPAAKAAPATAATAEAAPAVTARPAPAVGHPAVPARSTSRWVRRDSQPAPATRQAAPLAAAPAAAEPAPADAASAPAAAVPAPGSTPQEMAVSLADFCKQAAPGAQRYQVRNQRDTVLLGQQGTRLVVPAGAFDVPPGSGPVQLELREFYSTADIVLAGLGTRAGLDVLETGGMVHLYASAGGQTVHMRPGPRILVQMPTRQQLPGMRFYEGVSIDVSHAPDWQLSGTGRALAPGILAGNPLADRAALQQWTTAHPPKSPRWPAYPKGEKGLLKEVARLLPTTKADQAYLRRKRTAGPEEQRLLKDLSRENHASIRLAIIFAVQLDSAGNLQQVRQVAGDSVLAPKVLATLRQLPAQRPASFISTRPHGRRTISPAQGFFSVLYARSGKQLVGFEWLVMDKQLREEIALATERSRVAFARSYDNASAPLTLDEGLYYELAAGGLGWINCDRLLEPGPRILYTVATPDPATVVSLVFKGQRSILSSSRTEGSAALFDQVPAGAAATVVALRRQNGVTYLATSPVSLTESARPALDFRPVSLEQLRTVLAQL